jgi:hypothetical protein
MEVYLLEALPVELVRSVWVNWLTLIEVAHVDTAMCRHKARINFLDGVYGTSCVYDYSNYFDTNKSKRSQAFNPVAFLSWVMKRQVKLASLSVYNATGTDLLERCPDLLFEVIRHTGVYLRTIQVGRVTEPLCAALKECCPALQNISCVGTVNPQVWYPPLIRSASYLRHLLIEPAINSAAVREIALHGEHIQSLAIRPEGARSVDWHHLLSHLPSLTALDLVGAELHISEAEMITQYHPGLLSLQLSKSAVADEALLWITEGCTQLQSLSVGDPVHPSTVLTAVERCRGLTSLLLSARIACAMGVMETLVQRHPQLRQLIISYNGANKWPYKKFAQLLSSWPQLEVLKLPIAWASDRLLKSLGRNCTHLRTLMLYGFASECTRIADDGIIKLAEGCLHLQQFVCDARGITAAAVHAIAAYCRYIELVQIRSSPALLQVPAFRRFLM